MPLGCSRTESARKARPSLARYWATLELDGRYVDIPDGLEGDELEQALEDAVFNLAATEMICNWDADEA